MVFSLAFAIGPWAGTIALERFGARVLWALTFLLGAVAAGMFLRLPEPAAHKAEPDQTLPDAAGPAEI
jgi:predicted MFS family arabinose efflux permease